MKNFDLEYNLFDNEIKQLRHRLEIATHGYEEREGWLKDSESEDILLKQLEQMEENRNTSKKIILNVLNDKANRYPLNVKLFYITDGNLITNDKNKLLYDGKVEFGNNIFKDIIIDYFKNNNFVYQDSCEDIINLIKKCNKIEEFASKLVNDLSVDKFLECNGVFGEVIQDYINSIFKNNKLYEQGTQYDLTETNEKFDKLVNDIEKQQNVDNIKKHNQNTLKENLNWRLIEIKKDQDNYNIALLKDKETNMYVIAYNYDERTNSWQQGHYLNNFNKAVEEYFTYFEKELSNSNKNSYYLYNIEAGTFTNISEINIYNNSIFSYDKFVKALNEDIGQNFVLVKILEPYNYKANKMEFWKNEYDIRTFSEEVNYLINIDCCKSKVLDLVNIKRDYFDNTNKTVSLKDFKNTDVVSHKYEKVVNFHKHINNLQINEQLGKTHNINYQQPTETNKNVLKQ